MKRCSKCGIEKEPVCFCIDNRALETVYFTLTQLRDI